MSNNTVSDNNLFHQQKRQINNIPVPIQSSEQPFKLIKISIKKLETDTKFKIEEPKFTNDKKINKKNIEIYNETMKEQDKYFNKQLKYSPTIFN
jgi:hypothetical protein